MTHFFGECKTAEGASRDAREEGDGFRVPSLSASEEESEEVDADGELDDWLA
jgi:hypothetical protein